VEDVQYSEDPLFSPSEVIKVGVNRLYIFPGRWQYASLVKAHVADGEACELFDS
jgi:hypothetical protein